MPMPPPTADLVAPRNALAYLDVQSMALPYPLRALEAWDRLMAKPLPFMKAAFAVRDAISARFGVKRIGGFSGTRKADPAQGDMLDFFLIERIAPDVLTLTVRDRHLDVMTCVTTGEQRLTITSSVTTHNWFGKAYMVPVGIAHRAIVRATFARLRSRLAVRAER